MLFLELDSVHPYSLKSSMSILPNIFFFFHRRKFVLWVWKQWQKNWIITARFETKIVQDFTFAAIHFYSNKIQQISLMGLVLCVCERVYLGRPSRFSLLTWSFCQGITVWCASVCAVVRVCRHGRANIDIHLSSYIFPGCHFNWPGESHHK